MSIETNLTHRAEDDKRGMTFGELVTFVEEGTRAGVPNEALVRQVATWRSTIKELKVSTQVRAG
ncbi:hypothetical protein ACGFIV_00865 [Sphaerisporangium sp. NPDC049003]|uniref:hypothetical protein n=1 Tax=Sphaerisporangium sp. NPDC049003 TaxID=3364517 RepID=UPI00371D4A2B